MNIGKAIEYADALIKNNIDSSVKRLWLSELDGRLLLNQYDTHKNMPLDGENKWVGHLLYLLGRADSDTDFADTDELLAGFPFDGMYVNYLCSRIYLALSEIIRYQNESGLFADKLIEYENHISRCYAINSGTRLLPKE